MATLVFNIHDAKTNLSRIVDDVAARRRSHHCQGR